MSPRMPFQWEHPVKSIQFVRYIFCINKYYKTVLLYGETSATYKYLTIRFHCSNNVNTTLFLTELILKNYRRNEAHTYTSIHVLPFKLFYSVVIYSVHTQFINFAYI